MTLLSIYGTWNITSQPTYHKRYKPCKTWNGFNIPLFIFFTHITRETKLLWKWPNDNNMFPLEFSATGLLGKTYFAGYLLWFSLSTFSDMSFFNLYIFKLIMWTFIWKISSASLDNWSPQKFIYLYRTSILILKWGSNAFLWCFHTYFCVLIYMKTLCK